MFDIPLPIYFFIKKHPLKTSNKKTHSFTYKPICFFDWTKDVTIDKPMNKHM